MQHIAKLFMNGRSQAVRIPVDFRFDCEQVFIRKDPDSGDLIISETPGSWESFFKRLEDVEVPENFMSERESEPPQEREW